MDTILGILMLGILATVVALFVLGSCIPRGSWGTSRAGRRHARRPARGDG